MICNICIYMYIYIYTYIFICIYIRKGFLKKRQVFPTSFHLAAIFKGYLNLRNLQKISLFEVINKLDVFRGRSRTPKHLRQSSNEKVKGFKL